MSDSTPRPLSEPLLDAGQVAELLRLRPSTVYELVRNGQLPCIRIGRHLRFTRTDLEARLLELRDSGRGR